MNILIGKGCRSDDALYYPLFNRMKQDSFFNIYTLQLKAGIFLESFKISQDFFSKNQIDLTLILGDRTEIYGLCLAAFLTNHRIVHYGSGITNYPPSCFDDYIRHQISLVSDICLCEDQNSYERMCNMVSILRLNDKEIHRVGNLYLDDLELDFSLCPSEPYDLVLINAETLNPKDFNVDNIELYRYTIFIGSNPDKNLVNYNYNFKKLGFSEDKYYDNLPRNQYLGLLSKCKRFISNSSSIYYESPLYLKPVQIIHVGLRNLNRSTNFEEMKKYPNTANKIITILKEWWLKNGKEE